MLQDAIRPRGRMSGSNVESRVDRPQSAKGNPSQRSGRTPTDTALGQWHLPVMGYYEAGPPRHGHRNPSELAEDEILSSFRGKFCGMPASSDALGPEPGSCTRSTGVQLLPWADAHPLACLSQRRAERFAAAINGEWNGQAK